MAFFYFFDIYTSITVLLIIFIICSVIHYKLRFTVWSKQGLKGPQPLPFIGTFYVALLKDAASLQLDLAAKYGRVYGNYEISTPMLMISDPKIVKQVTVKDFHIFTNRRILPKFNEVIDNMVSIATDSDWKRLRKVISPTFTSGKIKRMKPLIEQCIRNGNEFLEVTVVNNEMLNLKQYWARFTLEVIACCCFARDINSHKDPDNVFFKHVTQLFSPPKPSTMVMFMFFALLPESFISLLRIPIFPTEPVDYLSAASRQLIVERRKENKKYNDFLQLLLEAEKESEDKSEPPLTENEIIANCILFFAAGYETTATFLTWSCYVLATNPEIQENLFEELKANIENVENMDYETIKKLTYLDAFVSETLRMFPPVLQADRMNSAEVQIEGTSIIIPPKSVVTISIYAMHHDPEYFPEPEKFIPERFIGENRESIDPYAYLPFGSGPRNCVAMRFALFEAKLALIATVMKFKIIKTDKTPTKPTFAKATTFLICDNIFVKLEKR